MLISTVDSFIFTSRIREETISRWLFKAMSYACASHLYVAHLTCSMVMIKVWYAVHLQYENRYTNRSPLGFMSGVLIADNFLETMNHPSTFMQGLIASVYTLGCFFGCISSIFFVENLGRKKPILIGTSLVITGAILQTSSFGIPQFIVGRIVSGFGTGMNTSIIPVWQAETLPAKKRERWGTIQYVLVPSGAAISYWMSYGLSYAKGPLEWRFPIAAQMVFAVIVLTCVPFMPESPRWLINHNRMEEALNVLRRTHGTTDPRHEEVVTEVNLITQAIELEELAGASGWLDLFKMNDTQNLRRIMLGWWLMAMVMLSGVCSIGYYSKSQSLPRKFNSCSPTVFFNSQLPLPNKCRPLAQSLTPPLRLQRPLVRP